MAIRVYNKDHLNTRPLSDHVNLEAHSANQLQFWTCHPVHPCFVNLNVFRDGYINLNKRKKFSFSGRPSLIYELAPTIKSILEICSEETVNSEIAALRAWWRLFDEIEIGKSVTGSAVPKIQSIADIADIHRQYALDSDISKGSFNSFVKILNLARASQKLPRLHWIPRQITKYPHNASASEHVKFIRFSLKHEWRRICDNWESSEKSQYTCNEDFNPTRQDAQIAFHLCLSSTGWNPTTLLNLDTRTDFLSKHPKDPLRYILRGRKPRGESEHIVEGLFKSRESPGMVINAFVEQTKPLRLLANKELSDTEAEYELASKKDSCSNIRVKLYKRIVDLREICRSPWIFVNLGKVSCLTFKNYSYNGQVSFLDEFVKVLNCTRGADNQISRLKPTDFRKAFAEFAYRTSGGSILYVMSILKHKSANTTQTYLNQNMLNMEGIELYRTFSNTMWNEIKQNGRVDPTVLAYFCQDGEITSEQRLRLSTYRSLRRSRINVGCKDPFNPPQSISPQFLKDGKNMCHVQRCTLCIENAVIFPDSMPGLCKRLAELQDIQSKMSAIAFIESSFSTEMRNTEFALKHFDDEKVSSELTRWKNKIRDKQHIVIAFEE